MPTSVACERLTLGGQDLVTEQEHLARYRFAAQFADGCRIADIACGTGYGAQMLAEAGAPCVHGMDLAEDAVEICLESYTNPRVTYSVANAEDLFSIPNDSFDMIVSFETIEHLPHVEAYLLEMVRILRPGGRFLVSTPDRRLSSVLYGFTGRPANPFHVREYDEKELLEVLSAHFEIEAKYGQRFVRRWLAFWPVQFLFRLFCRLPGLQRARALKDRIYSHGAPADVTEAPGSSIPKFWVISCIRTELNT